MILKTADLKKVTDKILPAVDSSSVSNITENLEMYVENNNLCVCVTNGAYYVRSLLPLGGNEDFHATVNATLFLKLVSQITTEDVEFKTDEKTLFIRGNGKYKLPLIYDGANLLVLPKITIDNPTCEMSIDTGILHSISKYNSREMKNGLISRPVQKMYYVDENGAITFTTNACVNNFKLEKPVKMLLDEKIVKLLKLFRGDKVKFTLGYDSISQSIIQTKVKFADDSTEIVSILPCDDSMLGSVPSANIRGRATSNYPYSVVVNKNSIIQAINRLSVIIDRALGGGNVIIGNALVAKFSFGCDGVTISDESGENSEFVNYANSCDALSSPYVTHFDIDYIKDTLSSCEDAYLTLNFGDSAALVIARANVFNVTPEMTP